MSLLRQRAMLTSVPCCWIGLTPLLTRSPLVSCHSVASAPLWFHPAVTAGVHARSAATSSERVAGPPDGMARPAPLQQFQLALLPEEFPQTVGADMRRGL